MVWALEADRISASYGDRPILHPLTLRLAPRERLAVIGPNGAGKSTLFARLCGQVPVAGGALHYFDALLPDPSPAALARIGVGRSFQVPALFDSMGVREAVTVAAHAANRGAEAEAILVQVDLAHRANDPTQVLDHGDRKRLDLALALAVAPRLLLLDEPTAGMASGERAALYRLISRLAATGVSVLFTEHDMDAVFAHADRIAVLHQGRLIAQGTPEGIRANRDVQAAYLGNADAER
jgi:branched-chain amino acid transport system ATP-binding protein